MSRRIFLMTLTFPTWCSRKSSPRSLNKQGRWTRVSTTDRRRRFSGISIPATSTARQGGKTTFRSAAGTVSRRWSWVPVRMPLPCPGSGWPRWIPDRRRSISQIMGTQVSQLKGRRSRWEITNSPHLSRSTVQYSMKYPEDRVPLLSGGPLKSQYRFEQLHFHWALRNNEGSEHLIDNQASAMEMHVLFRNTKYEDVSEASNYRNGLAVVGFLFEVRWTG